MISCATKLLVPADLVPHDGLSLNMLTRNALISLRISLMRLSMAISIQGWQNKNKT
jgi:hypothetical protein